MLRSSHVFRLSTIVKIGGKAVAELMYGGSVTIPVTPGGRRLRVDNTWNWKTLDLDVAPATTSSSSPSIAQAASPGS